MAHRARSTDQTSDDELEIIDVAGASADRPPRATKADELDELEALDDRGERRDPAEPRRARRRSLWFVVVATSVALVAIATVSASLRNGHHKSRAVTLRTPNKTAVAPSPATAVPSVSASARALKAPPFVIAGAGGVYLVDVAHSRIAPVPAVSDPSTTIVDRAGSLVLVRDANQLLLVDLSGRRPTLARRDVDMFPASGANDFWVSSGRSLSSAYGNASFTQPAGQHAFAAVDGANPNAPAFLVATSAGDVSVWSPTSRSAPRPLLTPDAHIVATRRDRVAWTGNDCGELRCAVHVSDVATGADSLFALPFAPAPTGEPLGRASMGRFSPDGRLLAVLVPSVNGPSADVAVFDLATGAAASTFEFDVGGNNAPTLPFDWTPDSRRLVAVEPGDRDDLDRLAVVDARSGAVRRSDNTLPVASTLAAAAVATRQPRSPALPPPHPLLGEPTGITIANVDQDGTLERLDLDTGRVTTTLLRAPDEGTQGVQNDLTPENQTTAALAGGLVVVDNGTAFWVPHSGSPRPLDPATVAFAQNPALGWIVSPTSDTTVELSAINGLDGTVERSVKAFESPVGIVAGGFVEDVPATIDHAETRDVWDPSTGAHHPIPGGAQATFVTAAGDVVVWRSCPLGDQGDCPLEVSNLATGATKAYPALVGRRVSVAPDGHAIAFVPDPGDATGSPQVLDTATGTLTPLPEGNAFGLPMWGPHGWIFYAYDAGVLAWRPRLTTPITLPGMRLVPSTAAAF